MAASTQESHHRRLGVVVVVADDVSLRSAGFAGPDVRDGSPGFDPRNRLVLDVGPLDAGEDDVSVPLIVREPVVVSVALDASIRAGLGAEAIGELGDWFAADQASCSLESPGEMSALLGAILPSRVLAIELDSASLAPQIGHTESIPLRPRGSWKNRE